MTAAAAPRRRGSVSRDCSAREWAVLQDLARVRLLTGRHVQRLHLSEGSPLTQARRTRSLLQRMTEAGLLHRLERRIGGVYAGSSGYVYGLSTAGQRLANKRGPAGGVRLRKPWEPSSQFTDHVLAVSELYVQLREAEAAGQLELLDFQSEPACWRYWTGLGGERQVLKPDAFISIASGDYEYRSFVEVDRSTESSTVIRRKATAYVSYWQNGSEQARHGIFPAVVWLVPDDHRKQQVIEALARLPAESWQLFRVALNHNAIGALSGRSPPGDRGHRGDRAT